MSHDVHAPFLREALALARLGKGDCAPNPAVGALVVKDGVFLSKGFHHGPGLPHAEVDALSKLGDEAKGATLYVTLEPCCHWGKTPPCTKLVREREIANVVYAFEDPNPVVAGKGASELTAAGIACDRVSIPEIDAFYRSYAFWTRTKRPWVTAKLALSLDGKIAGPGGSRVQLTSETLQAFTHRGRKESDAILTTASTVLADNPQLNVRLSSEPKAKPIYVLDRKSRVPSDANIFTTGKKVTLLRQSDLTEMLQAIGADGVHDLWVEAGGTFFESLVRQGLVNQAFLYVAPKWLGDSAQTAFSDEAELFSKAKAFHWSGQGPDALCEVEF